MLQMNETKEKLIAEIRQLKQERNAAIMAHYYTDGEIQDLADVVGDSLALAQKARTLENPVIVLCGVHFMGETAKILCPDKTVLVPDMEAGCSLADSCPADEFEKFVNAHPGYTVVSYVNTSAAVKALTDVVVTSSNARQIVDALPADAKIIFGPDRNLGNYINSETGRRMLLWDGACHVHEQFSLEGIINLKKEHPEAKVLVHPECKRAVALLADKVGSTAALLQYAIESPAREFIVATESGILHKMRQQAPDKTFIPAPPEAVQTSQCTANDSSEGDRQADCGCNNCNYMKLNTLEKLRNCLRDLAPAIEVDPAVAERALRPIDRMLEMSN